MELHHRIQSNSVKHYFSERLPYVVIVFLIFTKATGLAQITMAQDLGSNQSLDDQPHGDDWPVIVPGILEIDIGASISAATSVEVSSSLGYRLEDARVTLSLKDGPDQPGTTQQDRIYTLEHQHAGRYAIDRKFLGGSYEAHLHISSPDHANLDEVVSTSGSVPGHFAKQLYHNNYYEQCNEITLEPYNISSSEWDECQVNPDRLIESFGRSYRNIDNSGNPNVNHYLFNKMQYNYAPDPSQAFGNFGNRSGAYNDIFKQIIRNVALAEASVKGDEILDWIDRKNSEDLSVRELASQGVELISGFDDALDELNEAFQAINAVLNIEQAYQEGTLDGVVMYLAYQSIAESILDRIKVATVENDTWISEDRALESAINGLRSEIDENKNEDMQSVARAMVNKNVGEVVANIILGAATKSALKTAGYSVTTLAKAAAAPALVAGAAKVAAGALVYDLFTSVQEATRSRALLTAALQLDRHLFSHVPDSYKQDKVDAMEIGELTEMLTRLQLGLIFNETRTAYFAGEHRTWIGEQIRYSDEGPRNQYQAYELEVSRVSREKSEQAEKDIELLIEEIQNRHTSTERRNYELNICDTWSVANSGGVEGTIDTWDISELPEGAKLDVRYEMFTLPDRLVMEYPPGDQVLDTGWRGDARFDSDPDYPGGIRGEGEGQAMDVFRKDGVKEFIVRVDGVDDNTAWEYQVRCRAEE